MPEIEMPSGRYISLVGQIRAGAGGQTKALLMRNQLFAEHAGLAPAIVTFNPSPSYAATRATLHEQGLLADPVQLLNIFDWYRAHDLDQLPPLREMPLPAPADLTPIDEPHPDGFTYRTRYVDPRSEEDVVVDYRRADGSVFARVTSGEPAVSPQGQRVTLANSEGQPVAGWARVSSWRKAWIDELTPGDDPVFIICDSRFTLPSVLPVWRQNVHVLHVMHAAHTVGKRHWNSPASASYEALLRQIRHVDGLVLLTDRQRQDVAKRLGATNNLFVVPNPVEPPTAPEPMPPRDTNRFAVVCVFKRQKRLEHALRAFRLVVDAEPETTLDLFGDGLEREFLESEIRELGLEKSVTMHGYDPRARESLWTATAFLMTSRFEGYPLATLEAMSHGCPVVSYDIKYGPREQITDGVDGYLIRPGDIRGFADAMLKIVRDPALQSEMSAAALVKAGQHDYRTFLADWRAVLETAASNKAARTSLKRVHLKVTRLRVTRDRQLEFQGRLTVHGRSKTSTLDSALVTLDVHSDASDQLVSIPLVVSRDGDTFTLSGRADVGDITRSFAAKVDVLQLRLRLVWNNSSWQAPLTRTRGTSGRREIVLTRGGELRATGRPEKIPWQERAAESETAHRLLRHRGTRRIALSLWRRRPTTRR